MTRPRRQLRVAERPELPAERRLADRDAERLPHPGGEVDQPPPHHAVGRRVGPRSTIRTSSARCASLSFEGLPGGLRLTSPSGPSVLNRSTVRRGNRPPDGFLILLTPDDLPPDTAVMMSA
jgi:hypothetical protein